MTDLRASVEQMIRCRKDYDEYCMAVWNQVLATHPEIGEFLTESGADERQASQWFCTRRFDKGTRSAAELCVEGRVEEVLSLLGKMSAGVYL